jgi:integrase
MLRAILADSKHELKKRIELRKSEMREFGEIRTPLGANREPMNALEWVQLPFAKITSDHINDFVEDRSQYVAPASVDRQLDLLSSVVNTALIRWGYHLERSPMAGVKRPQYFNDRTRRVSDEEEALLLAAARQEDQLRSLELHVQTLAEDQLKRAKDLTTHYSRNDRRKTALLEARRKAVTEGFPHIPMYETFVQFQLATAARRGEALGLFWDRMNFKAQTAYLPTSKNGKPRTLYVRTEILELIQKLPRDSDVVFDITIKNLQGAWDRICEAAGIEDLHIHDLRHEGISRAVESGMFPTVLDLQAYSGHRDVRSLVRYYHPASDVMNGRLEAAEKLRQEKLGAEGRARLQASALMVTNVPEQTKATAAPAQNKEQPVAQPAVQTPLSALVESVEATDNPLPSNVTRLKLPPQRWANAAVAPQSMTN